MAQVRFAWLLGIAAGIAALGCGESHMAGGDAGTPADAGATDAGTPWLADACRRCVDVGPPPVDAGGVVFSCAADDARAVTCPAALCDGPDSYAWDGERCLRIDCGACEGADCGVLTHSLTECEAAHSGCVPQQCRATGGEWLFFTEECEHYVCGQPQLASCEVGMPVCNCGSGRSWVDGVGCAADPGCPEVDPLPSDVLCASTGGTWTDGICCSTTCGRFCDLDCAAPGCVCGAMEVFDSIRGCVRAAQCFEREVGETCGAMRTRCGDGLICCQHCTGVGCAPDMTCEAPVCDADPTFDECGNNLRAP